jgi:signal transduction histidine kinase
MSSARNESRRSWARSLAVRLGLLYAALSLVGIGALLGASYRATSAALSEIEQRTLVEELAAPLRDDREASIAPLDARDAVRQELTSRYGGLLLGAALIAVLAPVITAHRLLRPIRELVADTQRVVRAGDFGARVGKGHQTDEVGALARAFDDMLAHNERLVRSMRDALDHVAHDLRTPLTRLRAMAELALRDRDPDAQRDALADVVEESDRVLSMLRTLTDIGEAESGVLRLSRRTIELGVVAREVVDLYAHVADEAGVTLRAELREPVSMQGDAVRVAQALANLVDNAIKYTRPGGEVLVQVVAEGRTAVMRVRDTGIGIPVEALTRIWERLYRVDASRSQRGLGLGLSFVKAIAEAHGGVALVTSQPGRGSTFELRLPR